MSMKNSNNTIGDRNRELPACNAASTNCATVHILFVNYIGLYTICKHEGDPVSAMTGAKGSRSTDYSCKSPALDCDR
jgi:hypothetical protein